jgi:hypothetical protein
MAEGQQGAFPVPPGETYNPDFSHPWLYTESRAVVIAGVILCTITLMLRVYTKAVLLHKFGWDDGKRALSIMFEFRWPTDIRQYRS